MKLSFVIDWRFPHAPIWPEREMFIVAYMLQANGVNARCESLR
ncbi:hypothetical protein SAMN05216328_12687 [Ensifer sp. YR511]|nr:hypothetical protein SAMN05216328_12687 [Ensifer sp. YR511]